MEWLCSFPERDSHPLKTASLSWRSKEIVYNQDPSKIKMTLRPLPELDLEMEGDKVSFDERQIWLPGLDSNQQPFG